MFLFVSGSLTYAYFSTSFSKSTDTNQVSTATLSLKLNAPNEITLAGALPGASADYSFSITNTDTNTTIIENEVVPSSSATIKSAISIEAEEVQNYKLSVTFLETYSDQNSNINKSFVGRIQISTTDGVYFYNAILV